MRRRALPSAGCLTFVVLATSLALTAPAAAKDVRVEPHVAPAADAPLTPEESATLERALDFDRLALATNAPAKSFDAPSLAHPQNLDVSRSERADGSSTVTVKQPLSRDWDAKVGADVDVAADPTTTYEPGRPLPGTVKDNAAGAAWASVGVTRFATVDARVEPGQDKGTLGAAVEHSVPVGDDMSVTLHSRYAVSDTLPATTSTPGAAAPGAVVSNDQGVKLNIGATGTTLSADVSANSTDPVTHNTLSADQTVYGPLHVTTAITDAGEPTSSKSVSAGFKLTW